MMFEEVLIQIGVQSIESSISFCIFSRNLRLKKAMVQIRVRLNLCKKSNK